MSFFCKTFVCEAILNLTHQQRLKIAQCLWTFKSKREFIKEKGLGIEIDLNCLSQSEMQEIYKIVSRFYYTDELQETAK